MIVMRTANDGSWIYGELLIIILNQVLPEDGNTFKEL